VADETGETFELGYEDLLEVPYHDRCGFNTGSLATVAEQSCTVADAAS
jgi:hypothetical protein